MSWFEAFYEKRVNQNRDLTVLISDASNERGTGKTTLALKLAEFMDRTDRGMTYDKVTLEADSLKDSYTEHPRGSSLILDEAEAQLSKYRAASGINKSMRDLISQGRLLEKYTVFTAPASDAIDNDLKGLFDVWILVQRRGKAVVHYCDINPYRGHPLFKKKEPITWTDLEDERLKEVYDKLARDKEERLSNNDRGDEGDEGGVSDEVKKDARDELIKELDSADNLTQHEIAEATGLSRSRVADIVSES